MRPFEYARATSTDEAARASADGASVIAGGTNLLDLMKLEVMAPSRVVDIGRLELRAIDDLANGGLRIGALVTNTDCAVDRRVRGNYEVLSRAILAGASGQLRNMATTGGNLGQRTRCAYFTDTASACNKRHPGSGCAALGGVNRSHAIFGASDHCIATYPGDMAVALAALDAQVEITGTDDRRRTVPVESFHRLPGTTPHIDNVLDPGEMITAVTLPPPIRGTHAYRKVRDRSSYAFALVSVAAVVAMNEGRIGHVALAFGGVAHKPWRDRDVEQMLRGQQPSIELFDRAADRLVRDAVGRGHNDFKIPLLRRVLRSVLAEATGQEASR